MTLSAMVVAFVLGQSGGDAPLLVLCQPGVKDYAQVLKGFGLTHKGISDEVDVDNPAAIDAAASRSPEIVVALGSKAFEVTKSRWAGVPVVAAAISATSAAGRTSVTAVPTETRAADALTLLAALAPGLKKVAAFYPASNTPLLADARQAAQASGLNVTFNAVADVGSFQGQFKSEIVGNEAAWVLPDNRLVSGELFEFMAQTCLEAKVALIGFNDGMTAAGALGSVAVDYKEVGKEAARLTMDVAAAPKSQRGTQPFRFAVGRVTVSQKTMSALGIRGSPPPRATVLK
jgi:ABC-type uncharacterized transport system substrate-binding protein